jgi:hypothetical protein
MIDELQALRSFRSVHLTADPVLVDRARSKLLAAIREELAVPGGSKGTPSTPDEVRSLVHAASRSDGFPRGMLSRRRIFAGCVAIAASFTLVSVVLVQGGDERPAAAALQKLANTVAQEPLPSPGVDQDYFNQEKLSVTVSVGDAQGATAAEASFVGTESLWTGADGSGVGTASWGAPQFASGAEQSAWNAIPGSAINLGPVSGVLISYSRSSSALQGILDVSNLPTNEAALAQAITDGATGIPAVDSLSAGSDTSFDRIGLLLAGPDVGDTSQLRSDLFNVLSDLPGVSALGTEDTDSGQAGVAFGAPGGGGATATLIVNASTGALMELEYAPGAGPELNGVDGLGTGSSSKGLRLTQSIRWVEPRQSEIVSASSAPVVKAP